MELVERLSTLESQPMKTALAVQPTASKTPTFAEQAAKEPNRKGQAPKTAKDLRDMLKTREEFLPYVRLEIKPPKGSERPLKYLARVYHPSEDNVRPRKFAEPKDSVIVHLKNEVESAAIQTSTTQKFILRLKRPKIVILGTNCNDPADLARDLYEQYSNIRELLTYTQLKKGFSPVRR